MNNDHNVSDVGDGDVSGFEMMGWPLVRLKDQPMPLVSHVVLADRIGMDKAKTGRELIERNRAELEKYGEIYMRRTVRRISKPNGGIEHREVDEYLLNEGQALCFATLARTPASADVRFGLIRVFLMIRELVTTAVRSETEALRTNFGTLCGQFERMLIQVSSLSNNQAAIWTHIKENQSDGGYINPVRFAALKAEWYALADVEVAMDMWGTRRAALADIMRDMREATDWGGKAKPWNELPATLEPVVRSVIKRRMKDATKRPPPKSGQAPKSGQLSLLKTSGPFVG